MEMIYRAHGLRLDCSFPLPGMHARTEAVDSLPSLRLALRDPTELEHVWSGASRPPEWRGRLGDGRDLVIERGSAGDLLFSYGELARFLLDPNMRRLDCAPHRPGLEWQRTLVGKIVPSISVMLGYEALHAAALDSPDGVVAIMGPSGSGKSTLALELLHRGWPLFADDVLTLAQAPDDVCAHPGTPHMSLADGLPDGIDPDRLGSTLGVLAGERWLSASKATRQRRPVRMLCLLKRGPDLALEIHALPANPVLLAPHMLGLSSDPERQRRRFCLYADLMASATLMQLTVGFEHRPRQVADLIVRALTQRPELATVAP